ncbi:lipoprotein insertase outer membrane protein LolB [Saccharospirillum salsuginis]|uniref:Outer-membrane lipoprotein LolB n=1 Tax=Saccharospirillum salsuginis TaxID=418750 RepID=A0A918NFL0_9GAMM|nr:lipoprotein insertase outer membrane protein LolB [Saccharospirillum salsuginis]GGX63760.1 outer-membrane lipoprotein LolB [Saccharospirillum salsuginis]
MRVLVSLLIVATLAGCANFGPQPDGSELTEHWSFTGKMAVRNTNEASSFNVEWQQMAQAFEIELSGPLGQGAAQIKGQPGFVTMQRGNDVWQAGSLSELADQVADLQLPLDHLQYWVRAKPFPGSRAELLRAEDSGQVTTIRQSGWEVTYPSYYGEGATALPRRIDFERDDRSGRLVIRNWMTES